LTLSFGGHVIRKYSRLTIVIPHPPASLPAPRRPISPRFSPQATWPVIQAVLQRYDSSQVAFTLHLFPLPYHVYGFIASQSMHAVAAAGKDPFAWLEAVFAAQEQFGNDATANMTAVQVEDAMGKLAEQTPGVNIPRAAMVADLHSSALDQATRISWKLSCSRGVSGTPTFFANGARLAAGPSWTVRQWMALIDQVLA